MSVTQRMTAEKFIATPTSARGWLSNLIDGEVVVNDPSLRHGAAQESVLFALNTWARAAPGRGRAHLAANVQLDDRNVFIPDVLWYREERRIDLDSPPPYPMPDLAIEVRSPSTWRYDIGAKKAGYEAHGLPELWLVDTEGRTVLIFRRSEPTSPAFDVALEIGCAGELTSPLLPGFALAVSEVFPSR